MKIRTLCSIAVIATLGSWHVEALGQEPGPVKVAAGGAGQAEGRLSGLWVAEFQLDSAWGAEGSVASRVVRGEIVMRPVPHLPPGTSVSRSVHPGLFDVNFRPFGFVLTSRDALGWYVGSDAIRMRLHPVVNGGSVEMHGVFEGEQVTGSWRHESNGRGEAGRFVLRRSATGR